MDYSLIFVFPETFCVYKVYIFFSFFCMNVCILQVLTLCTFFSEFSLVIRSYLVCSKLLFSMVAYCFIMCIYLIKYVIFFPIFSI